MKGRWLLLTAAALVGACTMIGMPAAPAPSAAAGEADAGAAERNTTNRVRGSVAAERTDRLLRGGVLRNEVRALWVVRGTLVHPDSVRVMVDRAEASGFNTLLVQVRGRADAFYLGDVEPRSEMLAGADPTFDPLALVLNEAHARGMDVHAWINVHLVHGVGDLPADRRHLVHTRPDLLSVPRELAVELDGVAPRDPRFVESLLGYVRQNRERVEGLYTSPSHPDVHDRVVAVIEELVSRYPVDGIHLDYLRHPAPEFDYSYGTRVRFQRWARSRIDASTRVRLDALERDDPLAYPDALPALWSEFRRASIDDLVARVSRRLGELRPDLPLTAAVRADYTDAYASRYQDWDHWLRRGWVDAVAPMAYTDRNDLFDQWLDDAVERAGRDRVWAGIGAYRTSYQGAVEQVRSALGAGVGGVALFSYDWAVAEGSRAGRGFAYLDALSIDAFGVIRPVD